MTRKTLIGLFSFFLAAGCASSPSGTDATTDTPAETDGTPCSGGLTFCSGACVNLQNDHSNCGTCGNACAAIQTCSSGRCMLECPSGETDCGGECVDTKSDRGNCGSCGHACDTSQVCNDSSCGSACDPSLTNCSGSCVDLQTNRSHCGSCGNGCDFDENCVLGSCSSGCGNAICSGSDGENQCNCPSDCGACGGCCLGGACYPGSTSDACGSGGGACTICGAGQSCISGSCLAGCGDSSCDAAAGENQCNCPGDCGGCAGCCTSGSCYPGSDVSACGSGGETCSTCTTGQICSGGDCACPGTPCGSACCASGEICVSGRCCDGTWKTYLPNVDILKGVARDGDGTIYVSGRYAATDAYVAALDGCGTLLSEGRYFPPGTYKSMASAVALAGYVYCTGHTYTTSSTDSVDGSFFRFSRNPVTYLGYTPFPETVYADEGWDITVADDGSIWMSGDTGSPLKPWIFKGDSSGSFCSWKPFGETTAGIGRGIFSYSGRIYMTGNYGTDTYIVRYLSSSACSSAYEGLTTFSTGGAVTIGQDIAVGGSYAYVAGTTDAPPGAQTMAAKVNLVSGSVERTAPVHHPTGDQDMYIGMGLSPDGSGLYIAGAYGYRGIGEIGSARCVIAKLSTSDLSEAWLVQPSYINACYNVTADPAGGIIVVGAVSGGSYVIRCDAATGTCEP